MPLKPENIEIRNKIIAGVKKAFHKLVEERAANNDTLVLWVNGEVKSVPAKEILKKYQ
jgi:hypothetical protein